MKHEVEEMSGEALAGLREFIKGIVTDNKGQYPNKVEVYTFGVLDDRIGEIDATWNYEDDPDVPLRMGGCSWMRGTPESQGMILAAEDFLRNFFVPIESFDEDSYYDAKQEAEQALRWHLTGDLGEWEDRR